MYNIWQLDLTYLFCVPFTTSSNYLAFDETLNFIDCSLEKKVKIRFQENRSTGSVKGVAKPDF
jgi:hypothetical protein